MDDEIDQSFPAINRALELLRARLLFDKKKHEVTPESIGEGLDVPGVSPAAGIASEKHIGHVASSNYNVGGDKIPLLSSTYMKDLVIGSSQRAFRNANIKGVRKNSLPPRILEIIRQSCNEYLLRLVFSSFRMFTSTHKRRRNAIMTAELRLADAIGILRKILPPAVQRNCVNRLGKLKLAELFYALQVKRIVFLALLKLTGSANVNS